MDTLSLDAALQTIIGRLVYLVWCSSLAQLITLTALWNRRSHWVTRSWKAVLTIVVVLVPGAVLFPLRHRGRSIVGDTFQNHPQVYLQFVSQDVQINGSQGTSMIMPMLVLWTWIRFAFHEVVERTYKLCRAQAHIYPRIPLEALHSFSRWRASCRWLNVFSKRPILVLENICITLPAYNWVYGS